MNGLCYTTTIHQTRDGELEIANTFVQLIVHSEINIVVWLIILAIFHTKLSYKFIRLRKQCTSHTYHFYDTFMALLCHTGLEQHQKPVDPLQWMGAVRLRVQTADKSIKRIYKSQLQSSNYLVKWKAVCLEETNLTLRYFYFSFWPKYHNIAMLPQVKKSFPVLSAVWTIILTAPIHCRRSIGEQVM